MVFIDFGPDSDYYYYANYAKGNRSVFSFVADAFYLLFALGLVGLMSKFRFHKDQEIRQLAPSLTSRPSSEHSKKILIWKVKYLMSNCAVPLSEPKLLHFDLKLTGNSHNFELIIS